MNKFEPKAEQQSQYESTKLFGLTIEGAMDRDGNTLGKIYLPCGADPRLNAIHAAISDLAQDGYRNLANEIAQAVTNVEALEYLRTHVVADY